MRGHFSTAYLPPITWWAKSLQYSEVCLERHESWQKQSYRNRCYILGPNGRQMLNIPILHNENKSSMGTVEISYDENWQHTHWQAMKTAYGSAPFFEILGPELQELYSKKIPRLFDWNRELITLMLNWLQVDIEITTTESWKPILKNDHREDFHPKKKGNQEFKPYPQVFDDRREFEPNLSIVDLLFNEGPAAFDYLRGNRSLSSIA